MSLIDQINKQIDSLERDKHEAEQAYLTLAGSIDRRVSSLKDARKLITKELQEAVDILGLEIKSR